MPERAVDRHLDITGDRCPMTFVRARLALDALVPGQLLSIRLRGEEPRETLPRSVESLGHRIIRRQEVDQGDLLLLIERR